MNWQYWALLAWLALFVSLATWTDALAGAILLGLIAVGIGLVILLIKINKSTK